MPKRGKRKVQGVPQSQTAALSPPERGRGNRQIKTSTNQINVRKALRSPRPLPPPPPTGPKRNRQIQTSTNRTNVQKALRLAQRVRLTPGPPP